MVLIVRRGAVVRTVFVPLMKHYAKRVGLSERLLRRRLEKTGWIVWRGGSIHLSRNAELYPTVRKKYALLSALLNKHRPGMLERLQYICAVHHGMPDFICYCNGQFKFVECKLGHEQLSTRQKTCLQKLKHLGFRVEIHRLADPCTKARLADVDLCTGKRIILEKQTVLRARLRSSLTLSRHDARADNVRDANGLG